MSVSDQITRISDNFLEAYIACAAKSATITTRTSDNLPSTIMSIPQVGTGDTLDSYISGAMTIINSDAATVKNNAFAHDILITQITLNNATVLGVDACIYCTNLESINIPEVITINGSALQGCEKLKELILPKVTSIKNSGVRSCTSLELVDFYTDVGLDIDAFNNCSNLRTLIFRGNTMASVSERPIFKTPFNDSTGSGGTVYVPSSLVSTYQNDSGWSALNATIKQIEGSKYEHR